LEVSDGQSAVGTDRPAVVYDVPYALDAKLGVRVFDTRGNTNKSDGTTRQWGAVFATTHDVTQPVVLGNGKYRIRLPPVGTPAGDGDLVVEEFLNGSYNVQADTGGSTDLIEVDVSHIGLSRASARLAFDNGNAGRVDMGGAGKPLLSGNIPSDVVADLSGSTPSTTHIETWPQAPGEQRTLFARSRLR
jgi:hypothetical protein